MQEKLSAQATIRLNVKAFALAFGLITLRSISKRLTQLGN